MDDRVREKKQPAEAAGEDMKGMIRVVPSSFWMILLGGMVIMLAIAVWTFTGWTTSTLTVEGIYHPGASEHGEILCFPPLSAGKFLDEGMEFSAALPYYNQSEFGHMQGEISYTEPYVTTEEDMMELLEDESLVRSFSRNAPLLCVVCKLKEDPDSGNGFYWTNAKGGELKVEDGSVVTLTVITSRDRPNLFGR